ncbi:MAG: PilN domain-containing protein [Betaproteobacteria bacterium]|nr:PilN domain-containing protein [Betaproteobacteria bacterium]
MADIDLIPAIYLKRQLVRELVRGFAIAVTAVVVLVGAARVGLNRAMESETANVARLQKAADIYAQTEAKADGYREQRKIGERQLSQLDELRGRDRLKLLLQAIDAAYSPGIWFDELRFLRRENLPTGTLKPPAGGAGPTLILIPKGNVPVPGAAASRPSVEQRVELIGHATDHTRLAEFMRTLSAQPGITDVRLLDTGLRTYTNTRVIDMSLTLLIDARPGRPQ